MKRVGLIAAAGLALALNSAPASANLIFDLSNANLQYGGLMTGSITLNDALTDVISLNISVPTAFNNPFTFAPLNYTFPGGAVSEQLPFNFIRVDQGGNQLQLSFGQITAAGVNLITNGTSYDFQSAAGSRILTSGSLVPHVTAAVPEPATWMIMLSALGLVGAGFFRRRQTSASALPA